MNAAILKRAVGQNLIEFALTFPIFLLIVIGIIDLGRIVYAANVLQNATREGARHAIIDNCASDGEIAGIVRDHALAVDPADITVNPVDWEDDTVQVSASASLSPLTPLIANLIPGGVVTVNSSSTMLRESWKNCGP